MRLLQSFCQALLARPAFLLPLAPLLWASNLVLARALGASVPPATLSLGRWIVALAVLLPFIHRPLRRQWPLLLRHWRFIALSGALGIAGFSTLGYAAMHTLPAAEGAFLNSSFPLILPLLAWVFLGERVGRRRWFGIAISFLGVAWIISKGHPADLLRGLGGSIGELLMLAAILNYTLYSVLLRRRPAEIEPAVFLAAAMMAGIVILIPAWLWEMAHGQHLPFDLKSLVIVGYTGVFVSLLAYAAWNHCIARLGAAVCGVSYHLLAVFAPILAYIFLGESLEAFHLIGIALILTGFALAMGRGPAPPVPVTAR